MLQFREKVQIQCLIEFTLPFFPEVRHSLFPVSHRCTPRVSVGQASLTLSPLCFQPGGLCCLVFHNGVPGEISSEEKLCFVAHECLRNTNFTYNCTEY